MNNNIQVIDKSSFYCTCSVARSFKQKPLVYREKLQDDGVMSDGFNHILSHTQDNSTSANDRTHTPMLMCCLPNTADNKRK